MAARDTDILSEDGRLILSNPIPPRPRDIRWIKWYLIVCSMAALVGILLLVSCMDLFAMLAEENAPSGAVVHWPPNHGVLAVVALFVLCGTLGGTTYAILIFCYYLGVGTLDMRYRCWYWFRPIFGATMAALLCLGLVSRVMGDPTETTLAKMAFLAGLAGLFAEKLFKKLAEVARTLFGTQAELSKKDLRALVETVKAQQDAGGDASEPPDGEDPSASEEDTEALT